MRRVIVFPPFSFTSFGTALSFLFLSLYRLRQHFFSFLLFYIVCGSFFFFSLSLCFFLLYTVWGSSFFLSLFPFLLDSLRQLFPFSFTSLKAAQGDTKIKYNKQRAQNSLLVQRQSEKYDRLTIRKKKDAKTKQKRVPCIVVMMSGSFARCVCVGSPRSRIRSA